MNQDIKLTDFTVEQLHKLLVAVSADRTFRELNGEKDEDLQLWIVQILNAISTVQIREKITNS